MRYLFSIAIPKLAGKHEWMSKHPESPSTLLAQQRRGKFLLIVFCAMFLPAANSSAMAAFVTFAVESDWQVAAGTTVLENFESYAANTQISSLPALGISFDVLEGGGNPQTYSFGGTPHGSMQLGNFPNGINEINRWDDIVVRILPGYEITALGYWNGDGQSDTLIATAYDALDNVLGSVGAFKGTFAGFTSSVGISRVVFEGDTGDGWNHLDGLQTNAFASAAVPEPATLAMWSVMVGIGMILHRRNRRQMTLAV